MQKKNRYYMGTRLDRLVLVFMIIGCLIVGCIWSGWELIDWLFVDNSIKVTEPLVPELEITVKDNVIDTLYIYRRP